MDPFTQGIVGTTVAQSGAKKNTLIIASVIGLLAGLAADLDIFIRSSTDPLLFLQYHRHFTHSIFFIHFVMSLSQSSKYPPYSSFQFLLR